jgi:hypothetical protein
LFYFLFSTDFSLFADEVVEQIVETLQDFFGDYSQVCACGGVQMMRVPR